MARKIEGWRLSGRAIGLAALALWGVTIGIMGNMFVRGSTAPSADGRTAILLAPAERDLVLGEMRAMLAATQQVAEAIAEDDATKAAKAARAVGLKATHKVSMGLMAKLPLEFKQAGMAVHRGFDDLADAVDGGEGGAAVTSRLAVQLGACVGCHQGYRFDSAP